MSVYSDQVAGAASFTPSGRQANAALVCQPGGVRPTITTAAASIDGGLPLPGTSPRPCCATSHSRCSPAMLLARVDLPAGLGQPSDVVVLLTGWVLLLPAAMAYAVAAAAREASQR